MHDYNVTGHFQHLKISKLKQTSRLINKYVIVELEEEKSAIENNHAFLAVKKTRPCQRRHRSYCTYIKKILKAKLDFENLTDLKVKINLKIRYPCFLDVSFRRFKLLDREETDYTTCGAGRRKPLSTSSIT